jgi:ferredoxin
MQVSIDAELCAGHGRCYTLAPDVFESDDSGHGVVRVAEVLPSLHEAALRAARNCPERAITVAECD